MVLSRFAVLEANWSAGHGAVAALTEISLAHKCSSVIPRQKKRIFGGPWEMSQQEFQWNFLNYILELFMEIDR